MRRKLVLVERLFEVEDVFGKKIRTTKAYWDKIKTDKHADLIYGLDAVRETLVLPDGVYQGVKDPDITLYYRKMNKYTLVVVAKHLNEEGFVVTVYQTTRPKEKGEKLWPK